jgi:glycosyltransferase involved in cell wall biosynthesis
VIKLLGGTLHKVGILRGSSLNPYEGQYFNKLPLYGFEPIGITTFDNAFKSNEIPFPVRVGNNFKTLSHGKFSKVQGIATKVTKYDFYSYNFRIFNLKKLIKDVDIIHSADSWYPFTYQAVKTGIPTVVTEWENIPFNFEQRPYSKIKKYNHKHVSHFIAITEKAKEMLIIEGTNPDRINVIPAGIDCETFKPAISNTAAITRFGLSKDAFKILFVARFVPEKGILDLLNAVSMLLKTKQNVELLVVGAGTAEMQMAINKLITNLKIEHNVKFLGSIKYSEMPQIHNLADIFCLPSLETKTWAEQFGFSLVEAMACGKPAVSTYSGSIPEIVKHQSTGLLVEQHNPDALATAIEKLFTDLQLREKYGSNARQWVLAKFEAGKIAGQIAEVYRKVLT